MVSIRVGGDPEDYMQAPTLSVGGDKKSKGNGGFIANLFDALGIHRQVAKGPKPKKGESSAAPAPKALSAGAGTQPIGVSAPLSISTPTIPALDLAAKAFDFATPHKGYVALTPPMMTIDPDSVFK